MSSLTAWDIKIYSRVFSDVDADADGCLSMSELKSLCQNLGFEFDDAQIQDMFRQLDVNNDGNITLDEFLSVMQPVQRKEKRRAAYRRMFKKFDKNQDGFLSLDELHQALSSLSEEGEPVNKSEVEELIALADVDGDGVLNYKEFLALLKSKPN